MDNRTLLDPEIFLGDKKDLQTVRKALRLAARQRNPETMWQITKEALDLLTLILVDFTSSLEGPRP